MKSKDWKNLKITPINLSPINIPSFNSKGIKVRFNKTCRDIKEDIIVSGKHTLATIIIMPVMFCGIMYSLVE